MSTVTSDSFIRQGAKSTAREVQAPEDWMNGKRPVRHHQLTLCKQRDGSFLMSGGKYGDHTLCAGSSARRVWEHWWGYVNNNGL